MKKLFFAVISFAFLCLSCKENKNPYVNGNTIIYDVEDVPEYALSTERHMTHDVLMGRMSVVEDYMLLCNIYAEDSIFTVYNLDMEKPLASFGFKGQGPNDFASIVLNGQNGTDNGDVYVWVNDVNAVKMKRVNISKSLKENNVVVDKAISTVPMVWESFYVSDSLLVMKNYRGDVFYMEQYNPVSNNLTSSAPMYISKPEGIVFTIFNTSDIYDEKDGRYISAMSSMNQINFTDIKTNETFAVCVGDVTTPENVWDESLDDVKMSYYYDLEQNDKYVFALYVNKSLEELDSEEFDGCPVSVHVFDKEGKFVAVLKMQEYLTQIGLDKYGRIYGADDNNNIYRYKLPDELC